MEDLNYFLLKTNHQYDFSSIVYNGRKKKTKKNNVKKAKIILPLFE